MPRSCPAARQCHGADRRRFHRHAHRRVTPHGGAGSYRPRQRSPNTAVSSQDQVHPQPPDQRCAMCPRRPSCPPAERPEMQRRPHRRLPRPRQGQGPAPGAVFAGSPPPSTASGLAGDHLVAIHAATGRRSCPRPSYGKPSTSPGPPGAPPPWSPLPAAVVSPAWLYLGATTLVVLAPASHFVLDAAGGLAVVGPGHARYQLAQPAADTPPDLAAPRSHGGAAPGDADACYNLSPASDELPHIRRRRQAAGLPAVPGRS